MSVSTRNTMITGLAISAILSLGGTALAGGMGSQPSAECEGSCPSAPPDQAVFMPGMIVRGPDLIRGNGGHTTAGEETPDAGSLNLIKTMVQQSRDRGKQVTRSVFTGGRRQAPVTTMLKRETTEPYEAVEE